MGFPGKSPSRLKPLPQIEKTGSECNFRLDEIGLEEQFLPLKP
jgi:hypothetical protein